MINYLGNYVKCFIKKYGYYKNRVKQITKTNQSIKSWLIKNRSYYLPKCRIFLKTRVIQYVGCTIRFHIYIIKPRTTFRKVHDLINKKDSEINMVK